MKPAERRAMTEERPARKHGSTRQLELGTKGLLAVFFGLAVVCALFFSFGYTIGHHTIPATFTLGSAPPVTKTTAAPATPPGVQPPNPAQLGAAESNQTPATLTDPAPAGGSTQPAGTNPAPPPPDANSGTASSTAPAAPPQPAVNQHGSFQVLVFSGSQNDANLLAAALQGKSYPALVVSPASNSVDGLFRVEVGPYLTRAEAEAMRSRLTADGYQATIQQ